MWKTKILEISFGLVLSTNSNLHSKKIFSEGLMVLFCNKFIIILLSGNDRKNIIEMCVFWSHMKIKGLNHSKCRKRLNDDVSKKRRSTEKYHNLNNCSPTDLINLDNINNLSTRTYIHPPNHRKKHHKKLDEDFISSHQNQKLQQYKESHQHQDNSSLHQENLLSHKHESPQYQDISSWHPEKSPFLCQEELSWNQENEQLTQKLLPTPTIEISANLEVSFQNQKEPLQDQTPSDIPTKKYLQHQLSKNHHDLKLVQVPQSLLEMEQRRSKHGQKPNIPDQFSIKRLIHPFGSLESWLNDEIIYYWVI